MLSHDRRLAVDPAQEGDLVAQALAQYGYPDARATRLRAGDNTVYRVETASGETLALRLHTAARHTAQALRSELTWLDHLSGRAGLPVPPPRRSSAGTWVVILETGQAGPLLCTLLGWMEGESLPEGRGFDLGEARQAGELVAQLHLQAEFFVAPADFERPRYDGPYFLICWRDLEKLVSPHVPADRLAELGSALKQLTHSLGPLEHVCGGFGLIHADAHPGNFLQRGAELGLLDFDRCGWGPFLLDVAGSTLDLEPPERGALIASYVQRRSLPAGYENPLKALRMLAAVENLAFLATRPHELPFVLEALPTVERGVAQVRL